MDLPCSQFFLLFRFVTSSPHIQIPQVLLCALEQDELYEKFRASNDTYFEPERWKESRVELVRTVEKLLCKYTGGKNDNTTLGVEPEVYCTSDTPLKTVVFIIIDDNMFYRSMRRTFFNLARTYSAGFAQVHVTCPVEECIVRNTSRANPVPENIIREMATKFEEPFPTSHVWEHHTIRVPSHPNTPTFPWEAVMKFCEESIVVPDDAEEKEANRVANLTSVAHQLDLQARKAISAVMKDLSSGSLGSKILQKVGKELSTLKQHHIASIHNRTNHTDLQALDELVQAFQHDLQQYVQKIARPQ